MALTSGARIGPYEVGRLLGIGGMGEVYRGTDTNLGREVAIKVLPEGFAHDADRLARFEREARTLASFNHPHIAQIYGLEKSAGLHALVMELVEGPTLADQIAQGAMPLDEALPIAKQICEALEAAHEQGIIHRDLKPANIKVRPDGTVKVLDFGLAKAMEPAGVTSASVSQAPTITSPAMLTGAGMILGTAAYMSPEQARGKTVDKRADIWAFGAVLFEMLTGKRPFEGEDIAETLGAVIHKEPAWSRLPTATPAAVRTVVQRCLQKDPRQRLRDIGDVRLALDGAFEDAAAGAQAPDPAVVQERWRQRTDAAVAVEVGAIRRTLRRRAALVGAAALMTGVVVGAAVWSVTRPATPAPPETRVDIVTPATTETTSFALSPDGRQIVFVASGDGAPRLWLRPLDQATAQPLAGTEGAQYPFWSPDSRSVGFFDGSSLKRVNLAGGSPQTLAATIGRGGTWSADGVILFAPTPESPLFRVPASGGAAVAVTTLATQRSHRFPQFLPDGRQFLFYAQGTPDTQGLYLGSLDAPETTRLTAADAAGVYDPAGPGSTEAPGEGGWLLFIRGGTLLGQRLDLTRRALTGVPVTVADSVAFDGITTNASAVSVSAAGLVAYRSGGASRRRAAETASRPGPSARIPGRRRGR
ncbi:MAG: serine/threonine-protein kinase [Acidobacteria bacterium]|nr:serine/threonine-protein kinase [Acidobacteriota bacterium]